MESFIKIGSSFWAVEMIHTYRQTARQTHRQTYRQTHTLGPIAIYSVKITEYKKCSVKIMSNRKKRKKKHSMQIEQKFRRKNQSFEGCKITHKHTHTDKHTQTHTQRNMLQNSLLLYCEKKA